MLREVARYAGWMGWHLDCKQAVVSVEYQWPSLPKGVRVWREGHC